MRHSSPGSGYLAIGLIAMFGTVMAQPAKPTPPPPEAYIACQQQAAGSACAYETQSEKTFGLCMSIRGWELHCTASHRIAPDSTTPPLPNTDRRQ